MGKEKPTRSGHSKKRWNTVGAQSLCSQGKRALHVQEGKPFVPLLTHWHRGICIKPGHFPVKCTVHVLFSVPLVLLPMKNAHIVAMMLFAGLLAFAMTATTQNDPRTSNQSNEQNRSEHQQKSVSKQASGHWKRATFAGGCFWCMEHPFEKLDGVEEAVSGYMGGHVKNPTYRQVSTGSTGHREVIHFRYDPQKVSYKDLLEIYWRNIDPTDDGGQFVDRGSQYTTSIFYHTPYQRRLAQRSKSVIAASGIFDESIVTDVKQAATFYKAGDKHQDFCYRNPQRYKAYKNNSGRPTFLNKAWKGHADFDLFPDDRGWNPSVFRKPDPKTLKKRLSRRQYHITQEDGTEPRRDNKYWNNKRAGIYVDVVSGEPLFSSKHKWDSGTGWPHFYRPLVRDHIVTQPDHSFFTTRTEVRSRYADSHLGHRFESDQTPTGKTYCMNSAALEFIPVDQLEERGYGEFLSHFRGSGGQASE